MNKKLNKYEVVNTIKAIGHANGCRTYVDIREYQDNGRILDFMFQRGDTDPVLRIEIHLDEVYDEARMYDKIDYELRGDFEGFDVVNIDVNPVYPKEIYMSTGRSNGKHWLQTAMNEFYGRKLFDREYIRPLKIEDTVVEYCKADVEITRQLMELTARKKNRKPKIKKVIFNDPATIVFWSDDTKTVVKDQGEGFDPEKGLAMAISKKFLGNEGNYYEEFKKWLPEESVSLEGIKLGEAVGKGFHEAIEDFKKAIDKMRVGVAKAKIEKHDEKRCGTCGHFNNACSILRTCMTCVDHDKWIPKKKAEKNCSNCAYATVPSDLAPCCECVDEYEKWTPKEEK